MNAAVIGDKFSSFDGKRRWELSFEGIRVAIIDTGTRLGNDHNLVGFADDLRAKWVIGGVVDSPDAYDGIVNVWVDGGSLWAGTWSGFALRLDHRTGEILEQVFKK